MAVADVWLEGEHPDTKLVVVVSISSSPGCRFVHRANLWHPGRIQILSRTLLTWISRSRSGPPG